MYCPIYRASVVEGGSHTLESHSQQRAHGNLVRYDLSYSATAMQSRVGPFVDKTHFLWQNHHSILDPSKYRRHLGHSCNASSRWNLRIVYSRWGKWSPCNAAGQLYSWLSPSSNQTDTLRVVEQERHDPHCSNDNTRCRKKP